MKSSVEKTNYELVSMQHNKIIDLIDASPQVSPNMSTRERLAKLLNSHRFHIVILILIAVDCLLVFGELMIDLRLLHTCIENATVTYQEEHFEGEHTLQTVEHVLHFSSIGLLGIFVIEVLLKLLVFGHKFFYQLEELIDAIIVFVSFVLDIVYINNDLLKFVGALIFLRLWRIVRIVHAIITAVMSPLEERIKHEIHLRTEVEEKLKEALETIDNLKANLAIVAAAAED